MESESSEMEIIYLVQEYWEMKEPLVSSAKKDLEEKFQPRPGDEGRDETDSATPPQPITAKEEGKKDDDISGKSMKDDAKGDSKSDTTTSVANKMEVDEGKTLNKNVKKVQEKDRAKVSGTFICEIEIVDLHSFYAEPDPAFSNQFVSIS